MAFSIFGCQKFRTFDALIEKLIRVFSFLFMIAC